MVRRNSSRLGGNRPRTHPPSGRTTRRGAAEKAQEAAKTQAFNVVILRLKHCHSVVVTAAAALYHQNAEMDADVGSCLRYAVGDPLWAQIEQLEKLTGQGESDE